MDNEQLPLHVIDIELGVELAGSEKAAWILKTMLKILLPDDLENLQIAHQQQHWSDIQMITGHLYECSRYCGTPRLTSACLNLRDYLVKGETELREPLYEQLIEEIQALEKLL